MTEPDPELFFKSTHIASNLLNHNILTYIFAIDALSDVPKDAGAPQIAFGGLPSAAGPALGLTKTAPVFHEGFGPRSLGPAYQRPDREPGQGDFRRDFLESMDKKRMEEAEDVDVNAGIHGNWTMENAKSMLHQFIQIRRIKTDYKYSTRGSSFVAEMSFYVKG
jgi:ATP-dependent RNA helicase A